LLHVVSCLYYCISDARSHKYQMCSNVLQYWSIIIIIIIITFIIIIIITFIIAETCTV